MSLFNTGIRPAIDAHLLKLAAEKRDYGEYWSGSSAGYCMRKVIFERLQIPYTSEDPRKQRIFTSGKIFHDWVQEITQDSGLSIAQELELQDEDLMIRGHIDDLVLIDPVKTLDPATVKPFELNGEELKPVLAEEIGPQKLILYDYKTQNSRAFSYKRPNMSHYHKMQLGTYMYMLRNGAGVFNEFDRSHLPKDAKTKVVYESENGPIQVRDLTEARILKISKDDLRQEEQQLMWSPELEKEVVGYWRMLNGYWKKKTIPKCTCADYEGGFMASERYNPFFYDGEPCSIKWLHKHKKLAKGWKIKL